MNTGLKVLTGFSLGLLTGAIAGVLYAPEKGDKTRKKLKKNSDKYYKDSMDRIEDLKKSVNSELESVSKKSKETLDQIKSTVNSK